LSFVIHDAKVQESNATVADTLQFLNLVIDRAKTVVRAAATGGRAVGRPPGGVASANRGRYLANFFVHDAE
jgi:hypothetical protein